MNITRRNVLLGATAAAALGRPASDERPTPDGVGRFRHFERGSIYWHPATGAHEVHGLIRQKWAELGWELSFLVLQREVEVAGSRGFEVGNLTFDPDVEELPLDHVADFHGDLRDGINLPLKVAFH